MNHWLASILLLMATSQVFAQQNTVAGPVIKEGSCPSGYYTSGNYCVPSSANAKTAIIKEGSCPSGYYTSGGYCVANSESAKQAIPKSGPCPSGYYTSGNYCVRN